MASCVERFLSIIAQLQRHKACIILDPDSKLSWLFISPAVVKHLACNRNLLSFKWKTCRGTSIGRPRDEHGATMGPTF